MADSLDSKEVSNIIHLTIFQPFKFTSYLRSKLREQKGYAQTQARPQLTYQQELKEIGKRNVQIKKSHELEKKGILVSPYLFEKEAQLLKHLKQSKIENYQNLYRELLAKSHRLDKPPQVADIYILARIYKYVMHKKGKVDLSDERLEKDYFTFNSMYQQRLDSQKQGDIESYCLQIFTHKDAILASEQVPDVLEQNGFKYNESTFDDLYVRGFTESFINVSTDSSEEREEDELLNQEEEKKDASKQQLNKPKQSVISKDDYISEQIDTSAKPSQKRDRDLFNLDDESKASESLDNTQNQQSEDEEEDIDIDSLDPSKVNWFKYIMDKYLQLTDDEGNTCALNNPDAYANLLSIILTNKKNEEIQDELLCLVGFHNFELLEKLIERRDLIKDQCKGITEKLQAEKQGTDNYRPKNMGLPSMAIGVTVERGGNKKNKKQKTQANQMENVKISNYELLRRLGFDRDFIEENKKLGLKERQEAERKKRTVYLMEHEEYKKQQAAQSQIFEKPEMKKDHQIITEENDEFKYVQIVPPPKDPISKKDLVPITDLPQWGQRAFGNTTHLNQIQSKVYQRAFKTNGNLLISAPTGAGKTNIAMLTILREVSQHISDDSSNWDMSLKQFKIIYIAPLKALASEVVAKFQAALAYLKIQVRELTGDMNMSKQEIQETHIIVSTPEKWDVVTRKTDGMMDLVNCMIIDEIHLLNDERGLVLECLVARAFMTSLKMQKPVRIVGLSATLPNYEDVARFIGAEGPGTFYFDSSYRPTPLKCGFYGIKNLGNTQRGNNIMNDILYTELKRILKMGKQVIIFVHKRAETHSTAKELIEIIQKRPSDMYLFDCESSYKIKGEVMKSRNDQIKQLFQFGFSIHNAGLLRKDRTLVEKMFMEGHIKVLVSTATLAWGVNLPAYAVIIKGTKMYDSASGEYKDIGIFDVQQIFGRAGRPQFDTEGEAIILTMQKQMDEYVRMMANRQNIESNLYKGLDNCINAEIACGTIGTLTDGIHWLKKSYYYQRLTKNPIHYGIKAAELQMDPSAHGFLLEKVTEAVRKLNRMQLIRYNEQNETVYPTDMGRIASNYYINVESMSYFMENLKPHTTEEMFMVHLAHSSEFKQLEARKEEYDELKYLVQDIRYFTIDKSCFNEAYTKVLVLFECYLRNISIKAFSLIADMAYIVQNSARLLRAMFEIAMNKNYANLAKIALRWCHVLDKRIRPTDHPIKQFTMDCHVGKLTNQNQKVTRYGYLDDNIAHIIQVHDLKLEDMYDGNWESVKRQLGPQIDDAKKFLSYLPKLDMEINIMPITRAILKVNLTIKPDFEWSDRWNGKNETFWVMVDNEMEVLHSELFVLHKNDVMKAKKKNKSNFKNEDEITLTFFVPYEVEEGARKIGAGQFYNLHILSDRWYDIQFWKPIELSEIQVPDEDYPHTKLLKLRPMHVAALGDEKFELLYLDKGIKFFNPVQTQVFHALYHTDSNVLIGAPTGSGKTIMSEFSMLRVFKHQPQSKIIYIAPLKALAKERLQDWKKRLQDGPLGKTVLELTGDVTPDIKALQKADVLITTPEKWDGISRNWQHRSYVQQVALVIIDEIHLLGQDRGPVIEVIVSRMRYISEQTGNNVRFIGLSTALANAKDVADWLGIHKLGLYNFKPSVRPVPIKVFFEGFSEKHYCPRMATMNKPAYKAIMTHSKDHPVLVFVSSRRQTRLTALDLIALCAAEQQEREGYDIVDFKRPFLKMDPEEMHHISELIKDENLRHTMNFGVGMHHAGLTESDRKIVEDLFVKKKIQVLVTTSTLAWGVNFPARLVIIKGTEFYDPKVRRYVDFPLTDLLQMMGRAGRPQFDETGYACVYVHEEKKNFYKKFLYEPFPVESSLSGQIVDHLNAEIASGTLLTRQHCLDYLTWTYFFRRLTKNPSYYGLKAQGAQAINDYLMGLVNTSLAKLVNAKCIEYNSEDQTVCATTLGRLASFYYLSHETLQYLSQSLSGNLQVANLIAILANAKEFFGLPVRHNEDVLNEALTHLVPLKVAKHDLDNPHVKANLLIQAHLERCPLPITDYITDTKSVLDQSIRVLQGMIDVSAHKGHLETTLNLIHLMQMIIQGQWLDQSPLINIPNFTGEIIRKLSNMGIYYLPQLIQRTKDDIKKFFRQDLKMNLDYEELKEIYKALERVPTVELKYTMVPVDDRNEPLEGEVLQEGGEALCMVNMKRTNRCKRQKVVISHFPKPKDASWFLIIANPAKNEVLAMKRLSFNRYASKNLNVALPEDFLEEKLELYLMSDSYIGIDQVYSVDLIQINGVLQGKMKQKNKDEDEDHGHFATLGKIQRDIIDDLFSDEEDKQPVKVQKKEEKPAMHQQIRQGISSLLDDEDGGMDMNFDDLDEDEEEEDYDQMIEKDIDIWI